MKKLKGIEAESKKPCRQMQYALESLHKKRRERRKLVREKLKEKQQNFVDVSSEQKSLNDLLGH